MKKIIDVMTSSINDLHDGENIIPVNESTVAVVTVTDDEYCGDPLDNYPELHFFAWMRRFCVGSKHDFCTARDAMLYQIKRHVSPDDVAGTVLRELAIVSEENASDLLDDPSAPVVTILRNDGKLNPEYVENLSTYMLEKILTESHDVYFSRVYAMDHSMLSFSMTPYSDKWDSGLAGFIVARREDFTESDNWKDYAEKLTAEYIEMLNKWVSGDMRIVTIEIRELNDDVIGDTVFETEISEWNGDFSGYDELAKAVVDIIQENN